MSTGAFSTPRSSAIANALPSLLADHILKAAQMAAREGAAPLDASINATVLGF